MYEHGVGHHSQRAAPRMEKGLVIMWGFKVYVSDLRKITTLIHTSFNKAFHPNQRNITKSQSDDSDCRYF